MTIIIMENGNQSYKRTLAVHCSGLATTLSGSGDRGQGWPGPPQNLPRGSGNANAAVRRRVVKKVWKFIVRM
jgi:hypothetical protein